MSIASAQLRPQDVILCLCFQQEAVDKGWFRTSPCFKSPPKLDIILATAHQIATAMGFLHDRNVIHGDLTGGALFSP